MLSRIIKFLSTGSTESIRGVGEEWGLRPG